MLLRLGILPWSRNAKSVCDDNSNLPVCPLTELADLFYVLPYVSLSSLR